MTFETQKMSVPSSFNGLRDGSYVDWPAVFGGIVLAAAVSLVMLAFGSAIGLTFSTTASTSKGFAVGAGIGAALWFLWVQVSSYMAGAYLTGRLRKRVGDATEHEVEVRDGSHGLLVWAGAVLVGSYFALSGVSSIVTSLGSAAKTATESASVLGSGSNTGMMQYYSDTLLRAPATSAAPKRTDRMAVANEINTILAKSALPIGTMPPSAEDKTYLAQIVSDQTGAPPDVAEKKVNDVYASIDAAKAEVAKTAETARRVGIITAFLLAASLLVSAAAAFWAATVGGNHRDNATVFTGFFNRI